MEQSSKGADRKDRLTTCIGVETFRKTTAPFEFDVDSSGLRVLVGPEDLLRFNEPKGRKQYQTCGKRFHMSCVGRPQHLGWAPRTLWYKEDKRTGEKTPCTEECVEAHMKNLLCAECLEEACPGTGMESGQLLEGKPTPTTAVRFCVTQCTRQCTITTDAN